MIDWIHPIRVSGVFFKTTNFLEEGARFLGDCHDPIDDAGRRQENYPPAYSL
jgi:hypothetical protein